MDQQEKSMGGSYTIKCEETSLLQLNKQAYRTRLRLQISVQDECLPVLSLLVTQWERADEQTPR